MGFDMKGLGSFLSATFPGGYTPVVPVRVQDFRNPVVTNNCCVSYNEDGYSYGEQ